jgi:hypothetical protein
MTYWRFRVLGNVSAVRLSLTLNGLILDKRLLTLLKQIGDERMEILST